MSRSELGVAERNQVNVLELHYSYSGKFRNAVKDNGENIKFSMSTSTKQDGKIFSGSFRNLYIHAHTK
jgi:hypothetical protein